MPVIEYLQMRLRPGVSPDSESLISCLKEVRSVLKVNAKYFTCVDDDPGIICLIVEWPSVESHYATFNAPEHQDTVRKPGQFAEFVSIGHIDGSLDGFPDEAPIIAFAKLWIDRSRAAEYEERIAALHIPAIENATKPWKVLHGWNLEDPAGDGKEYFMMSGWESTQAHDEFRENARQADPEYRDIRNLYVGMEVKHARNLEK